MLRLQAVARHLQPSPASGDVDAVAWSGSSGTVTLRPRPNGITPDDIIMGCGPLRSSSSAPPEQLDAVVAAALEAGIVRFDSAPLYGDSEDNLGRGLRASPLGEKAIIYTKVGKYIRWARGAKVSSAVTPWAPYSVPLENRVVVPDYTKAGAAQSLKESMERMGLENNGCHTLRLHDADSIEGAIAQATDPENGIIAGLRELRAAGVITNVSFGMNANKDHKVITPGAAGLEDTAWTPAMIIELIHAVPPGTFDSCLAMEECAKAGIKVHVAGAMQALFGGAANAGSVPMQNQDSYSAKVDQWKELAEVYGVSLAAVALNFAALPSVVDKLVIGMRHKDEVAMNTDAMKETVPPGIWAAAQAQGLLPTDLPVTTMRVVNAAQGVMGLSKAGR